MVLMEVIVLVKVVLVVEVVSVFMLLCSYHIILYQYSLSVHTLSSMFMILYRNITFRHNSVNHTHHKADAFDELIHVGRSIVHHILYLISIKYTKCIRSQL